MTKEMKSASKSNNSKLISWATVAHIYNAMPLGVCECETIEDAKGYTKVLVLIVIAFLLAGMYDATILQEGGAL